MDDFQNFITMWVILIACSMLCYISLKKQGAFDK